MLILILVRVLGRWIMEFWNDSPVFRSILPLWSDPRSRHLLFTPTPHVHRRVPNQIRRQYLLLPLPRVRQGHSSTLCQRRRPNERLCRALDKVPVVATAGPVPSPARLEWKIHILGRSAPRILWNERYHQWGSKDVDQLDRSHWARPGFFQQRVSDRHRGSGLGLSSTRACSSCFPRYPVRASWRFKCG